MRRAVTLLGAATMAALPSLAFAQDAQVDVADTGDPVVAPRRLPGAGDGEGAPGRDVRDELELVGQVAANVRKVRKPDAYHGKGVRFLGEQIALKAGKAGATGGKGKK